MNESDWARARQACTDAEQRPTNITLLWEALTQLGAVITDHDTPAALTGVGNAPHGLTGWTPGATNG